MGVMCSLPSVRPGAVVVVFENKQKHLTNKQINQYQTNTNTKPPKPTNPVKLQPIPPNRTLFVKWN